MKMSEIARIRATYAHSTETQNQGGKFFAISNPNAPLFKNKMMNRDPHDSGITATATPKPMGRTVTVKEHTRTIRGDRDDG